MMSSLGAARRSDLGGAGWLPDGQPHLLRVPRHVIRAAVARFASVVRSLFRRVLQKRGSIPFDCYEQPFGDYPYVNHFLNPSHEDQLSDGEPICFSPNLKSSASVHGRRP